MATRRFQRSGAWHALAILAAGLFASVSAAGPSVPEPLRTQPMTSLAGQIEPGPARAMPEGVFLEHETGAAGVAGAAAIQARVANRGQSPVCVSGVDVLAWNVRIGDGWDAIRYRPLAHRNDVWYGSTYWTGPDWTRVGKDWQHPGENTPAVRQFVIPRDGRLSIAGRVAKYHADRNTDGVRVSIRHNAREIWHAEIAGGDDQGVEPRLTLEVRKGDALRFVVHKRGLIYCDTTRWDPVLRYADGETFQASKAFSTRSQGDGGWSYEMETDGGTPGGLPRVYALGKDLTLRVLAPEPNQPAVFDDRDALPWIVVADGPDQSGIALAMSPSMPWRFSAEWTSEGRLTLRWRVGDAGKPWTLPPGATLRLPALLAMAYRGTWLHGLGALEQAVSREAAAGLGDLRAALVAGLRHAAGPSSPSAGPVRVPELGLWLLVQADWRQQDRIVETPESYAQAASRHVAKTRTLLADLRRGRPAEFLAAEAAELDQLAEAAQRPGRSLGERRDLWRRVRSLKRRVALANPLLGFGSLLFAKRVPTSYSHLVMQYYGWRARAGGGLYVLDEPGWSLRARDLTGGKLACGNMLEPRLSYDARRVVFSFVRVTSESRDPNGLANDVDDGFYHIYEVGIDGSNLRQLTEGPYDDLMPTYLPDGGIAFSSTRRRGYARCFGGQFSPRWHVYTLHRMEADGSNLRTLSFHDTNEWFPVVSNSGMIVYSRWDYIDRDAVTHQNLWATRPDGTNPFALWGNATPAPHCAFQAKPIPGSTKFLFTASAHHSITAGSIAVVDPTVARDGHEAITRITPEIPFPEAEGRNISEYYASPWPLSERYYLVSYSPRPLVWEPGANEPNALGLYLLDWQGDRELLYRDLEIGCESACPIQPRPVPPVLASALPEGKAPETGEMTLIDVTQGLGNLARGHIRELRIVQIFPKTTHVAGAPPIGLAGEENGRAILGTVPVEPDGSARFTVPARRPILFQALDADGFAYQTMRSVTYVQPGENVACVGCHENRASAPVRPNLQAAALGRGPSPIDPGPWGGRPFSFVEVVQPVLDRHCIRCHGAEPALDPAHPKTLDLTRTPEGGFTRSYLALCKDRDFWHLGTNPKNAAEALVPRFGARNQIQVTPPGGRYGALGSRLIALLRKGHYEVSLTPDETRRLAAWIDLNAIFYGVNLPADQARQLRGERVEMPEIQ